MKKAFKLFTIYSSLYLKMAFQQRMGVVLFTAGKIFRFVFLLSMIYLVFSKTTLIKGYTLDQMIIFYLTFNVIDTASQLLFREVYRFRPQIVSGSFDLTLLKPHHPFIKILIGGIDFMDVILLIPYIFLTIYFIARLPGLSFVQITGYLLLIINAFIIATAFHISVLAFAILTTEIDHAIMIYRDLTGLARFPIDIYREPIRGIFTFIIPVGIMMSFPPKALLGLLSPILYALAFLSSLLLLLASLKLWNVALRKYQSWGG